MKTDFKLSNILLLCQVAGYVIAFLLSLCIIIPLSVNQDQFRGHCLLFSTGQWRESDGQFDVKWASQAYCNYTIFVGVLTFLISVVQIYRMIRYLWKGTDSSFLSAFIDIVEASAISVMMIFAGLIVTLGFATWCKNITKRFTDCQYATANPIDKHDGIDTSGFFVQIGIAQFGVWASWTCWVGLLVCAVLKICRFHQIENMRISMARERQRLIKDENNSPQSTLERDPMEGDAINTKEIVVHREQEPRNISEAESKPQKSLSETIDNVDIERAKGL